MTAPEREALVKARVYVNATATMRTHSEAGYQFAQRAQALLGEIDTALSNAPAVVTEERCREVLRDEWLRISRLHSTPQHKAIIEQLDEDVVLAAMHRIASEAALKSTTPQTGSQE